MESRASRSKSNPILTLIKRFECTGPAKQWTQISWTSLSPLSWSHSWQLFCWYTNNFSSFQSGTHTGRLHLTREKSSCSLLQMPCNSPNLLFIGLLLEVSRIQANGKTSVGYATKRHDFSSSTRRVSLWGWLLIAGDWDNFPGGTNGWDLGPCHIS